MNNTSDSTIQPPCCATHTFDVSRAQKNGRILLRSSLNPQQKKCVSIAGEVFSNSWLDSTIAAFKNKLYNFFGRKFVLLKSEDKIILININSCIKNLKINPFEKTKQDIHTKDVDLYKNFDLWLLKTMPVENLESESAFFFLSDLSKNEKQAINNDVKTYLKEQLGIPTELNLEDLSTQVIAYYYVKSIRQKNIGLNEESDLNNKLCQIFQIEPILISSLDDAALAFLLLQIPQDQEKHLLPSSLKEGLKKTLGLEDDCNIDTLPNVVLAYKLVKKQGNDKYPNNFCTYVAKKLKIDKFILSEQDEFNELNLYSPILGYCALRSLSKDEKKYLPTSIKTELEVDLGVKKGSFDKEIPNANLAVNLALLELNKNYKLNEVLTKLTEQIKFNLAYDLKIPQSIIDEGLITVQNLKFFIIHSLTEKDLANFTLIKEIVSRQSGTENFDDRTSKEEAFIQISQLLSRKKNN